MKEAIVVVKTSDMVQYLRYKSSEQGTPLATVTRAYESNRNSLDYLQNVVHGTPDTTISKYDYRTDTLGRRKDVVHTGSAFSAEHLWKWSYDDRSQLTGAERHSGTTPDAPGGLLSPGAYGYGYDPIGNRETHGLDGATTYYCANNLNQYQAVDYRQDCPTPTNSGLEYDDDGNLVREERLPLRLGDIVNSCGRRLIKRRPS